MKNRPALTLVELIVTMAIVAILVVGALYSFSKSRQNYALKLSADYVATQLERAHIYSRENKEEKSWGVRVINNQDFTLSARDATGVYDRYFYRLPEPTRFDSGPVDIWFDQVTGNVESDVVIEVVSPRGNTRMIQLSRNGVVTLQ